MHKEIKLRYIDMHTYMLTHVYINAYIHTCKYASIQTCVYTDICGPKNTHAYIVYTHMHYNTASDVNQDQSYVLLFIHFRDAKCILTEPIKLYIAYIHAYIRT